MTEVLASGGDFSAFEQHAERVQAIVLKQTSDDRPVAWSVLPTPSGPRDWLLVAATQNDHRLGLEQLRAFIGPDIARTEPSPPGRPDAGHRHQTIVRLHGKRGSAFLDGLELMLQVQKTQPQQRFVAATPLASLLADFRLEARGRDGQVNREKVRSLYQRIEATGLLSLENLRFLRVEMLATCGSWRELIEVDWFDELCRTRRPITITHRLLEAVWRAYFDELETGEDPDNAVAVFEERDLGRRYSTLFRAVDETTSKQGRRLLMVAARASGERERCERILESSPVDERRRLARLGGLDRSPTDGAENAESLDPIDVAFRDRAWGTVIDLTLQLDVVGVTDAQRLVEAAYELDDQSRCKSVAEAVAELDLRDALESRSFNDHLEWVRRAAGDHCVSWLDWVRKASTQRWSEAFRTLDELRESWSISNFQNSEESAEFAIRLLEAFGGPNRPALREALAHLCDLAAQLFNEPAAADVIYAVLEVLSADENPSRQVLDAYTSLLDGALDTGPGADRYDQMIGTGRVLWNRACSARNVDWVIDLVETVVMCPSPTPTRRVGLVVNVANDLRRFAAAVPPEARSVFDDITRELEAGQLVEWPELEDAAVRAVDIWAQLAGKTVGLYSRFASIGTRLESKLVALCPTVELEVNDDPVSTAALQALARSADYMIVDWRHAAHSATAGIDAVRDREDQILPAGGGVSSFLRALKEALVEEGSAA